MYKNLLFLPEGTEISSGSGTKNAIKNIKSTQMVNSGEELTIGSACSNMIEATLFTPGGDLNITAGDELTHYKVDLAGNRTKVGLFTVEQPTRPTPNTMKIVGYDRVAKLDKDMTAWLESLDGWPYSVNAFASMVCRACGLNYVEQSGLPNADFPIRQWKKSGATGRQIMRWLGEIVCRFVYADPDGNIRFGWYKDSGKSFAPAGENYFFAGSLTYENYQVSPVQAAQIRLADNDSGAVWPNVPDGTNSYIITGNPILTAYVTEALLPYLDVIAGELAQVTYTPCEFAVRANLDVNAGDIVHITDKNGKTFHTYVMSKITSGQRDTLSGTGSQRRDSSSATNNKSEADKRAEMEAIANSAANTAQSNAEKNARENLDNYAEEVSKDIANLQNQIDGNITSWFYDYVPTTANEPASTWTTEALKNQHLGDLFYITGGENGGMCYRWALINGAYTWQRIEDTEVAKALTDAAVAKDTADAKRRVFITQPAPPYDVGDLWAQGANGDLMRCKTARASGSYVASDWELASKYIDATTAGDIAQNKVNAQTQLDIFNKLTNNGQDQGIYMFGNKLYINATYIKSGKIVSEGVAYLPPTYDDAILMLRSLTFPSTYPPQSYYDLNGDGRFDVTDVRLANSVYLGNARMRDCAGAQPTTVTVTIDPFNADETIKLVGTNMWGSQIALSLGMSGSHIPHIAGDCAVSGRFSVGGATVISSLALAIGDTPKTLSWKSNGDGTFTLIGQ